MENTLTPVRSGLSEKTRQLIGISAGAAAQFALAAFLHYAYALSGKSTFAAIFAAVNESVWEHVKTLLLPYLLWSVAEYYIIRPDLRRFVTARCAGAVSLVLMTVCFFFVYSGVWGASVLWIDIVSAALWLLFAELICMRTLNTSRSAGELFPIAAAVLCLLAVMLLCFTVSPPKIGLFRDPVTQLYGLEKRP